MALRIRRRVLEDIRAHAEEAYPEECCGLLVAYGGEVMEAVRMRNSHPGPRHNRYSMDPMELYRVDREIAGRGGRVVGIYHSHPDHPAQPSNYDLEQAWPGISYLIVAVPGGRAAEARSWRLDDERTGFLEEGLELV